LQRLAWLASPAEIIRSSANVSAAPGKCKQPAGLIEVITSFRESPYNTLMKIHPLLTDPNAVLVLRQPLPGAADWEDFRAAAHSALSVMQLELEGESAVIKPNATSGERFANPDSGVTTHPGFVQGMAEYLLAHGARRGRVSVVEDPRDSDDNHPRNWSNTGFDLAAARTGLRLLCPTTYTCVKKTVPNPLIFPTLNVSRLAVAERSVLFNVPKLKTHNLAITTLGMKNLMGLVNVFDRHYCIQAWGELPEAVRANRAPRHEWFTRELHEAWQIGLARRLADTARVLDRGLTIVEGVVGREGTGFQRGRNRALGLVIAGSNVVAVDSVASWLVGFDPQQLIYLRIANEARLGENDLARLKLYTAPDGALLPCADPAALRVDPPFRVISGILGEDLDPFKAPADEAKGDPILSTVRSWQEGMGMEKHPARHA
jgi:uncharacterized protein (DUF362 family)